MPAQPLPWQFILGAGSLALLSFGSIWTIFNDKFAEAERRDVSINREISNIHSELLTRRHEFVQQEEFKEFEKRVDQYMATPFLTRNEFDRWRAERDRGLKKPD